MLWWPRRRPVPEPPAVTSRSSEAMAAAAAACQADAANLGRLAAVLRQPTVILESGVRVPPYLAGEDWE